MNQNLVNLYVELIKSTGEKPERSGLKKTPERAAKAFQSLTSGYQANIKEIVNGAIFDCQNKEMVLVKNIEFFSLCEHHLLPMFGKCHVAYIPNGKVLGLSKISRIVDVFARRLQIQEALTQQIAETISEVIGAQGVGVITTAAHFCMLAAGITTQSGSVTTMSMLGCFQDNAELKNHFMQLIKNEESQQ